MPNYKSRIWNNCLAYAMARWRDASEKNACKCVERIYHEVEKWIITVVESGDLNAFLSRDFLAPLADIEDILNDKCKK